MGALMVFTTGEPGVRNSNACLFEKRNTALERTGSCEFKMVGINHFLNPHLI
jgi:hypothetical protein